MASVLVHIRCYLKKKNNVYVRHLHLIFTSETDIEVPVMAGDSFTLRTGPTESDAEIEWWFGLNRILITTIAKGKIKYVDERFRESLQVERQTGDLIFTNVSDKHNGDYELNINDVPIIKFRVTVYGE